MSSSIHRRTFATVGVFSTLLVILITSILMFARSYSNPVATAHTVIGFIFLAVAIWHLFNNMASLKRYIHPKTLLGRSSKFSVPSKFAVITAVVL